MDNINNLLEQANNKFDLRDYKGAIELYNRIIELNPNFPEVFYNKGFAKYKLLDYQGAIDDFTKAIKLNPDYSEAFYKRGLAKDVLNNITQNDPEAFYNRGVTKDGLKDYKGAFEDYTKAFKINFKNNK